MHLSYNSVVSIPRYFLKRYKDVCAHQVSCSNVHSSFSIIAKLAGKQCLLVGENYGIPR